MVEILITIFLLSMLTTFAFAYFFDIERLYPLLICFGLSLIVFYTLSCVIIGTEPPKPFSAYVVAKKHIAAHPCCSDGRVIYKCTVIVPIHVSPRNHTHETIPESFVITIANDWIYKEIQSSKKIYNSVHCGELIKVVNDNVIIKLK